MTDPAILETLARVVRETFRGGNVAITEATTADDVDGWDSLSHALFLMKIERAFSIRFAPADAIDLENVGDLVRLVARLKAA